MPLLRSLLFAPGNVPRRVEKAFTLEADAVIVDLEDSVATSEKEATRKPVADALARPRRRLGYVRVNAPSSAFCYGDLVATVHKGVDFRNLRHLLAPSISAASYSWSGIPLSPAKKISISPPTPQKLMMIRAQRA